MFEGWLFVRDHIHIENTVQHMKSGRTRGMVIDEGGHYTGVLLYHSFGIMCKILVCWAFEDLIIRCDYYN